MQAAASDWLLSLLDMHAPGELAVRATYQQAARSITPFPRPRLGGFIEEQETVSFAPQPKATACPLPSVHIPYSSALSRASPASWGVSHRARRREAAAAHSAERALAQQHARAVRVRVKLHVLRAQPPRLRRHLGQRLRHLRLRVPRWRRSAAVPALRARRCAVRPRGRARRLGARRAR